MKKQKKVTLKIVSDRGHDTLLLEPSLALERVKHETQEKGKWAYIDGNFKSSDNLTEQDITNANEIVVVNALVGG